MCVNKKYEKYSPKSALQYCCWGCKGRQEQASEGALADSNITANTNPPMNHIPVKERNVNIFCYVYALVLQRFLYMRSKFNINVIFICRKRIEQNFNLSKIHLSRCTYFANEALLNMFSSKVKQYETKHFLYANSINHKWVIQCLLYVFFFNLIMRVKSK